MDGYNNGGVPRATTGGLRDLMSKLQYGMVWSVVAQPNPMLCNLVMVKSIRTSIECTLEAISETPPPILSKFDNSAGVFISIF